MKRASPARHTTPVDRDEKAYQALVESTRPTLPSRSASLEEIYSHFGWSHNGHLAQQHVIEHLDAQIAYAFRSHTKGSKKILRLQTLKRQLLLKHFADDEPWAGQLPSIRRWPPSDGEQNCA
jgi:hypothetical protein